MVYLAFSRAGKRPGTKLPTALQGQFGTTDKGLMEWWATLESNQAWVSPAELQSAAAPCSPSPIPTLRPEAQADNSLTYLGQGRQSTIIWAHAPHKRGTLTSRLFGRRRPETAFSPQLQFACAKLQSPSSRSDGIQRRGRRIRAETESQRGKQKSAIRVHRGLQEFSRRVLLLGPARRTASVDRH